MRVVGLWRLLAVFLLLAAFVMTMAGVALAQAAGVTPGAGPVGSEVTIFGSGFEPGEMVTVEFGGWTITSGFADDNGEFTLVGTIPEIPLGEHPMDVNGEFNFAELTFEVTAPPTTTAPTSTTVAGGGGESNTTVAETTVSETTVSETVSQTTAPVTTTDSTVPMTVEDDTSVSTATNGFPWWLLVLVLLVVALLGGGIAWAALRRGGVSKGGSFTDDQGNEWVYCEARACRIEQKSVTDTNGRRVLVRAVPRRNACAGCQCVLFENVAGPPKLLDEDGGWVTKRSGAEYSARCVRRA
jgi:hypothetical protein